MTTRRLALPKGARAMLLTVAIAALTFLVLSPIDIYSTLIHERELSISLRFIAQSLLMFVSFGVFLINWLPPGRTKDLRSVFIAATFLSTGLLTFAHILTCRELMNVLDDTEPPVGSYFHLFSGATFAIGLSVAAFVPQNHHMWDRQRKLILLGFLGYTAIVTAVPVLYADSIPSLCPHTEPNSEIRIWAEIALIVALGVASFKYYSLNRATGDMAFAFLGSATILGVFSHIAFTQHENPYDMFSAMSICYSIAACVLVFMALFRGGVVQPYEKLTLTQSQADRRRKEAEAATVKAQTYLDFLSHDVANMISPILNRAEIIMHSPNVSNAEREEARKIVEQMEKVASLIQNLRRLSSAERIDARDLGPLDLRTVFTDLEMTRKELYPGKEVRVTVNFPSDQSFKVRGGSVAEDIIAEIFDNAIKHSNMDRVVIEVDVHPSDGATPDSDWTIEIKDHGPGIPDQTKKALDLSSPDPKRRFVRGIASSLSVLPLIAEQLGGKIRIEDRVPGDYTQGTNVIITLPKAS